MKQPGAILTAGLGLPDIRQPISRRYRCDSEATLTTYCMDPTIGRRRSASSVRVAKYRNELPRKRNYSSYFRAALSFTYSPLPTSMHQAISTKQFPMRLWPTLYNYKEQSIGALVNFTKHFNQVNWNRKSQKNMISKRAKSKTYASKIR